jgi:hypothetical protein
VRTDEHAPSNLVTEDYEYVYSYDADPGFGQPNAHMAVVNSEWWRNIVAKLARVHDSMTQCDHCGAHMRYVAILHHVPSDKYITVGETCLGNRFDRATADFHRMRKAAALDREAAKARSAWATYRAEHPADWDALDASDNEFVRDVMAKGEKYGDLSDRQFDAICKAIVRDREREAKRAEWETEERGTIAEGRQTIEGEVISTKWQANDYGERLVMTVKDSENRCYWGTVPSKLDVEVGDRVRFVGTVTRSDKDESFGFFKRPAKGEVLSDG